jgi:hypothetical protein
MNSNLQYVVLGILLWKTIELCTDEYELVCPNEERVEKFRYDKFGKLVKNMQLTNKDHINMITNLFVYIVDKNIDNELAKLLVEKQYSKIREIFDHFEIDLTIEEIVLISSKVIKKLKKKKKIEKSK